MEKEKSFTEIVASLEVTRMEMVLNGELKCIKLNSLHIPDTLFFLQNSSSAKVFI